MLRTPCLFIYTSMYLHSTLVLRHLCTFILDYSVDSTLVFRHLCTFILDYYVVMERKGFKFGLFTVLVIVMLTKMGFDTWSFAV